MTEAGGAPPIAIAPFAPGDENGVLGLILAIQNGEFGIPISADQQPDLRAIPQFYQSGAGGFWVARCGLDIVGTIGLKDIGNAEGALRKMFVVAAHRGRIALQDRDQGACLRVDIPRRQSASDREAA